MKVRYLVEVEMKSGYSPMTERRVESAVWDSHPMLGSIRNVSVRRGDVVNEVRGIDLFAYAWKDGKTWKLLDYFNTHTKAANAVKRATVNSLRAFKKDVEFAVFQFNPNTSVWEKC
jgi:hypothetical protein